MKKLITLIIVAGLVFTIQAQDITNTLGTNGNFYVNDENDNEIIQIDAAGTFHFKNEVPGSSTQFDLYNAGHNLKLNFYKANGTPSSPTSVGNFSSLGILYFHGYNGTSYHLGASILTEVTGTVSGSTMPTALKFATQHTGLLTTRMTIKSDGTVNISDLAGTYGGGQAYVVVNDAGDLIAQDAVPSSPQFNNEIQELKAEIAELREMIELLKEEK